MIIHCSKKKEIKPEPGSERTLIKFAFLPTLVKDFRGNGSRPALIWFEPYFEVQKYTETDEPYRYYSYRVNKWKRIVRYIT